MSSYPYSQGLVPAIQQQYPVQLQPVTQLGTYNAPNAGQQAYLAALQSQIANGQKDVAQEVQGYQQASEKASEAPKKEGGGGFWGFLGGIAKKAIPLALGALV